MSGFFVFAPDRLRAARKARGMSREQLAIAAGSQYGAIAMFENGGRNPRRDTLLKLAAALDMDVRDLVEPDPFVAKSRKAQGLPATVDDPAVLGKLATLLGGGEPRGDA